MRLVLVTVLALVLVLTFTIPNVFADDSLSFGIRIIPDKIIENSEGVMQVYALKNSHIFFPAKINDLTVTSSDSSVIKILDIKQDNNYVASIKFKTLNSKTVNINIIAPGFSTYQFPITVYQNVHVPTQLLLKATPSTFSITKPTSGYISAELADKNGFPVSAPYDIPIKLTSSDDRIINLKNNSLIINKGEYYTVEGFDVKEKGDVVIHASSTSVQSSDITVSIKDAVDSPIIKLYVYPNKINSLATSYGYAIAQIQDASGNPMVAKEDIPVTLRITNSTSVETINTSGQNPVVESNDPLIIKKGTYWGLTKIVVAAGINGTYTAGFSVANYQISNPAPQFSIQYNGVMDDKTAKLDMLPILTTGNRELIGILHLEDANSNPILASKNLKIKIDSSNENALSIDDTAIIQGSGVMPVYGKVSNTKYDNLKLNVITEPIQNTTPIVTEPTVSSTKMMVEPAIQKILSNTDFPLAMYMTKNNGAMINFPENTNSSTAQSTTSFKIDSETISKDQPIALMNVKSLDTGSNDLTVKAGDYSAASTINTLTPDKTTMHIVYSDPLPSDSINIFVIQLLDSQQQPLIVDHDTEIKFISNNSTVLKMPEKVVIKKGDYYAIFSAQTSQPGVVRGTALSPNLPLSEFVVNVEDIRPQISISAPDNVRNNTAFDVMVHVNDHNMTPLQDMNLNWSAEGATMQFMDSKTDRNGTAHAVMFAQSSDRIDLKVSVSGGGFEKIEKIQTIGIINNHQIVGTSANLKTFNINGFDPLPSIILGGVVGVGLFMNRKKLVRFSKIR